MKFGFVVEISRFKVRITRAYPPPTEAERRAERERWERDEWEKIKAAEHLSLLPLNFVPPEEVMFRNPQRVTLDEIDEALSISDHYWRHGSIPVWAISPNPKKVSGRGR